MVFCNVDENVHEVFRISKLAPMFLFVEDRAAALALLAGQAEEPPPADGTPAGSNGTPAKPTPVPPPAPVRSEGPLRRAKRRDP